MNEFIKKIQADKIVYFSTVSSMALIVIALFSIVVTYKLLPPVIPLYNQMPWGNLRLGTKNELFILIAFGSCFYVLNVLLFRFLYESTPLIARILSITSILVSIFVFLLVARTILVVI